jgi:hypothetical protein
LVLVSPNGTTAGTSSFTLNLPNGSTSIPIFVQGVENTSGTAIVSVSAPGFVSAATSVSVVAPGVEIQSLSTTIGAGTLSDTSWSARVGIPNAGGTGFNALQGVRAGGPPFIVTLSNSNAAVAQLSSDEPAATGQTVTKPIQPGNSNTTPIVVGTSFGLTFHPIAAGSTTVTATGPAGVVTMSSGVRTVTVTPATNVVTIAATDSTATEAGNTTGTFTITRTGSATQSLSVSFTRGGTATAGTDYSNFSLGATIPAGATSTTVIVTPLNDVLSEPDETIVLTLTPSANYALGPAGTETATVTVFDAGHVVTIAATDPSAAESGDTGTFTITRTGNTALALPVSLTRTGTAGAGVDYVNFSLSASIPAGQASTTITVTPLNDTVEDPAETVILTLVDTANYSLGATGTETATVTIVDNAHVVTIAATDPNAAESGADTGTFTITRTGNTALALPVSLTRSGTAGAGGDYVNFSLSASIPAGQTSTTITVTPINDVIGEGDEIVILTLVDTANYSLGTPGSETATVTIADAKPVMTIAATDATAAETGGNTGTFTITRIGDTALAFPLTLTRSGTATAGSDYTNFSTSVTIPAGSASTTITLTPISDAVTEPLETVILTLPSDPDYFFGAPGTETATVTISSP